MNGAIYKDVTLVCEKHGEYLGQEIIFPFFKYPVKTMCPICGKEQDEKNRKKFEVQKQIDAIQEQIEGQRKLKDCGIPPRFAIVSIDTYKIELEGQQKAIDEIKAYIDDAPLVIANGMNLFLLGKQGTGKTHLAVAICKEFIRDGYRALYTTAGKLIRHVRQAYHGEGSEQQYIDEYVSKDLLIVDEVGVQFGTEAERNLLFEVFNGRYENIRPSVIVSNLNLKEIKNYLGIRVLDRLLEGDSKIILFEWESFRKFREEE